MKSIDFLKAGRQMKIKKNILCVALAVVLSLSVCSCGKKDEKIFHVESFTTSAGNMTVSAAYSKGGDEGEFTDEELTEKLKPIADLFEKLYVQYSSEDTYKYLNTETDVVFDCNEEVLKVISDAFAYSDKIGGKYEPAAGALTAGNKTDDAAKHIGRDKFKIDGTTVKKSDKLAKIDLQEYAFAYAFSEAAESLAVSGISCGRISIASSAFVFGSKPDGSAYTISLDNGGYFRITDGAVSFTDQTNCLEYPEATKGEFTSVTVFSPDALDSVMLSRVIFALTEKEVAELYKNGDFLFEAVAVKKDGTKFMTERAKNGTVYIEDTTKNADE